MDEMERFGRGESKWRDCCKEDMSTDRYSGTLRDGKFGRGERFGREKPSFGDSPRFER